MGGSFGQTELVQPEHAEVSQRKNPGNTGSRPVTGQMSVAFRNTFLSFRVASTHQELQSTSGEKSTNKRGNLTTDTVWHSVISSFTERNRAGLLRGPRI